MKLDKVHIAPLFHAGQEKKKRNKEKKLTQEQDNSGTIERDEFLSLPQISSNPLATRYGKPTPTGLVV